MSNSENLKKKFEKLNKRILKIKDIDVGILGGIHEKYWVDCGEKQYLFKYNLGEKDLSDFGEVFTSYLCYILGVKCVKSTFAEDFFDNNSKKSTGTLIESYRTKNIKESFSLSSLLNKYGRRHLFGYTVKEAVCVLNEFVEEKNLILDPNMEQELKEMALIDFLLLQSDRHANNIEFLIEEKDGIKTLKLAPMFDNGACLYLQNANSLNLKCLQILLTNKIIKINYDKTNPKPKFYIEETEKINNDTDFLVKDLAKELLSNKKLMNLYEKICKLDIMEEVEFVQSMRIKPIPNLNKNLIKYGVQNRIKLLNEEIFTQKFKNIKRTENDLFTL